jgi:hypothetical protein
LERNRGMKYKITIDRILSKPQKEEIYIPQDERVGEDEGKSYKYMLVDKEVEEEIYSQTVDGEIDLKAVIDAFNNTKKDNTL